MKRLSLVMIVKNEGRCLKRCLKSVEGIVDEIIIVDTGSSDQTKQIALSYGANIYDFKWENDFAKARNYALEQSKGDWNIILDADEYITHFDKEKIWDFMNKANQLGNVKIINELSKDNTRNYSKVFVPRLLPKEIRYTRSIHEQPDTVFPSITVPIEIYHDGYIDEQTKVKRNLIYLQEQIETSPQDGYLLYQLAYTLLLDKKYQVADKYFQEFYKFVPAKSKYRCAGIISYIENSMHLKKFHEGHKLIEKEEVNLQDSSEFYFVCAAFYREYVLDDVKSNIQYLPYVEQCYLECLNIGENDKYDGAIGTGSYLAAYNVGVWYEVNKLYDKATICYDMAIEWGYEKAIERKQALSRI